MTDAADRRARLLDVIRTKAYRRLPEPITLSSGQQSQDFVDIKLGLARGADLRLACEVILDVLGEAGIAFDAIGGLTMGADQFAHGVAVVGDTGWFVVRKERKGRGTNQLIEGLPLDASSRVVLVEDTVTTGGSIVKAFDAVVEESGAQVVAAVTICDRGDAATEYFAGKGVPYFALVTYTDLGIEPVLAVTG